MVVADEDVLGAGNEITGTNLCQRKRGLSLQPFLFAGERCRDSVITLKQQDLLVGRRG